MEEGAWSSDGPYWLVKAGEEEKVRLGLRYLNKLIVFKSCT